MIYIDTPKMRDGRLTSHMVADTLDELHDYAITLGLLRKHFQKARKHPHYDLWGFPLEQVLLRMRISGSGLMLVSSKELVLISHSLIKKTTDHGNSKERSSEESQLQNQL